MKPSERIEEIQGKNFQPTDVIEGLKMLAGTNDAIIQYLDETYKEEEKEMPEMKFDVAHFEETARTLGFVSRSSVQKMLEGMVRHNGYDSDIETRVGGFNKALHTALEKLKEI